MIMALTTSCQSRVQPETDTPFGTYIGSETRLLDGDLVNFRVNMRGDLNRRALLDYAECVAAQYTVVRGFGFARHLRTNVTNEGSIWSADAVYTISSAIPAGRRTLEAEITVEECKERGIPTV